MPVLPATGDAGRGLDESREQRRVVVGFGVPLHADEKRPGRVLDRLDRAVVGPGHGREAGAEAVDPLVMVGRHGPLVPADELVERGWLFDADPVRGEGAGRRIVILVADDVGQVLDERAAAEHVENLHAPADGEHRQAHALGRRAERQLAFVARGSGLLGSRMRLCPVAGRVDVRAAREQQAVETPEEGVEGAARALLGPGG